MHPAWLALRSTFMYVSCVPTLPSSVYLFRHRTFCLPHRPYISTPRRNAGLRRRQDDPLRLSRHQSATCHSAFHCPTAIFSGCFASWFLDVRMVRRTTWADLPSPQRLQHCPHSPMYRRAGGCSIGYFGLSFPELPSRAERLLSSDNLARLSGGTDYPGVFELLREIDCSRAVGRNRTGVIPTG